MAVKISELRHRITIQQMSRTTDGQGGWTESWADFATVWAKVKPMSAKERTFSQQIQENVTHKIVIRWLADVDSEMRISFEGRIFQIKGKIREDERRWFMEIMAEEGVAS